MNYQKIYDALIEQAVAKHGHPEKSRSCRAGYANHHIKPASLFEGGRGNIAANVPGNLAWLTHREHFVAHWLLARIYGGRMSYAFTFMCRTMEHTTGRAYEQHLLAGIEWKRNNTIIRDKQRASAKRRCADPEYLAAQRVRMAVLHSDPEFRAKRLAALREEAQTPEGRARYKAEGKRRSSDPAFKQAHSRAMEARSANPANREIEKRRGQQNKENPVWRENQAAGARLFRKNNPEWVASNNDRLRDQAADPKHRAKLSASRRSLHADPDFKAKHLARMQALHADAAFKIKRIAAVKMACASPEWQAAHVEKIRKQTIPVIGEAIDGGPSVYFRGRSSITAAGFNAICVSRCCNGKQNMHRGYTWRRAAPEEIDHYENGQVDLS